VRRLPPNAALEVDLIVSSSETVQAERLALDRPGAIFEYAPTFDKSGYQIDPLSSPAPGPIAARAPRIFDGLHGVFADSLPDAWGEELVRRRCRREGIEFASLTALDHLAIVGHRGMGALAYRPAVPDEGREEIDFDALASAATDVLEGGESDLLAELERLGGSSGGARPKILVALDASGHARAGDDEIPDGYDGWLVKFRSSHDVRDIGPLEAAYAAMARSAGIDVPDHRLIPSSTSAIGYFASKRFDRAPGGIRRHTVSAAGALEVDWTVPQIDYEVLLRLVRRITRNQAQVEEMLRRMIFNIVSHNRDDHAKQHAFIFDRARGWKLAPAYDLSFSSGPNGEHYLAVAGEARDVSAEAVRTVAESHGIRRKRVTEIVSDVIEAVHRFSDFANEFGVSRQTRSDVQRGVQPAAIRVGELARTI
jgi:serine/threonine-protein kinase HipA